MADELPACGLYRSGRALPGQEEKVPAGVLIYFHNHSEKGSPLILTPHENSENRWRFHDRGWLTEDVRFIREMVALKPEGLYVVQGQQLHVSREEIIPERTLVQLGYNRRGDTLLFPAKFEGLTITFPTHGYRFEAIGVQQYLHPVAFKVPKPRAERVLH